MMIRTTPALLVKSLLLTALAGSALPATAGDQYPNTSGIGQDVNQDEAWYQQCLRVEHVEPPAVAAGAQATSTKCDANGLYYDKRSQAVTGPAEWNKVRACALANSDDGVLMMLYANGYGVAKNPDLAIKYACSLEHVAKAEMEARIAHLLRSANETSRKPFDFCDDITSGYSGAVCASIEERQNAKVRQARLSRFSKQLAPQVKAAFAALQEASVLFAETRSDNESDMHGTGAAGFALQAKGKQSDLFVKDVLDAANGIRPHYTVEEYESLDAKLHAAYESVLHTPSQQEGADERVGLSTVIKAGVTQTEDVWLAYRDAWVTYVAAASINWDPASVKALLTQRRIKQLLAIPY